MQASIEDILVSGRVKILGTRYEVALNDDAAVVPKYQLVTTSLDWKLKIVARVIFWTLFYASSLIKFSLFLFKQSLVTHICNFSQHFCYF